jgi:flavin reductase (DIM6/NTAB) family NADH-FMN oxidoreductase RutF
MSIITSVKKSLYRLRFRFTKAEYMRVSYLNPRMVILVTARHNGTDNVMPLDWHLPLSFTPKLYGISIEDKNYSSEMISGSGVFAVNFMPAEFEDKMLAAGRVSGREGNKFELTGLEKAEAKKINAPLVKGALGYLECEVVDKIVTGDHTLYVGKVVREELDRSISLKEKLFHITKLNN